MASGLFIADRIYRTSIRFIWPCSLHRWKCCKVTWRTTQNSLLKQVAILIQMQALCRYLLIKHKPKSRRSLLPVLLPPGFRSPPVHRSPCRATGQLLSGAVEYAVTCTGDPASRRSHPRTRSIYRSDWRATCGQGQPGGIVARWRKHEGSSDHVCDTSACWGRSLWAWRSKDHAPINYEIPVRATRMF